MRKLVLVLFMMLLASCSKQEINTDIKQEDNQEVIVTTTTTAAKKEPEIEKRRYEDFGCSMNESEFYYCWDDEKDEEGHTVVYRDGLPIKKKVFDNGFVMYYDEEHPELGYTALHAYGGFAVLYNDYSVVTYMNENYDDYTIFFDSQLGEVITIIKGQYVFLEVNEEISTTWFSIFDDERFKLMSGDSLEWYGEYYLYLQQAPALQYSYRLGNGTYFDAYKEENDKHVQYILDMNGMIISESDDADIIAGGNTSYIIIGKEKKYGLMNTSGEEVLPLEYDVIETHENGIVAIKDNHLYIFSTTLTPLLNGEYEVAEREYSSYLCCENYNNFTAYETGDGLIVMTIDTDYWYRSEDSTLEVNPNYTHKFLVKGENIEELEYDFEY